MASSLPFSKQRRSLLSSQARIQVPWIKVIIGAYTFGVFSKSTKAEKDKDGFYNAYEITYPNYVQSLQITKINGQVNQYVLTIIYPITVDDDPNFFEKVFSSVSNTRKIVFSYGDMSMPTYIYKDEEAIITKVTSQFDLAGSRITYQVEAVSGAALGTAGCCTFLSDGKPHKPSEVIKKLFNTKKYGLYNVFYGMKGRNLNTFIAGDDQAVTLADKVNISVLEYITYLVSCMIPAGSTRGNISKDIYILTIHDDTTYDKAFADPEIIEGCELVGPYFKVTKTSYSQEHADAYEVDIGYNNSTIVSNFQIENNENYALYYDYQGKLNQEQYVRRINRDGKWEDVYAPNATSKNNSYLTRTSDITWWTKITKYPINASITIQGLIRPAQLMTYLRLNVIFPGGGEGIRKHIASGLYIITKQTDKIDASGYKTTLNLTKIAG